MKSVKTTISFIVHTIANTQFWMHLFMIVKKGIPIILISLYQSSSFLLLLLMFLFSKLYDSITQIPLIGVPFVQIKRVWDSRFKKIYEILIEKIEKTRTTGLRRTYLISLAYNNLMVKKARSFITILGMSVGIGVIVLLLSLGYGIERLIISRVAGLDELKMIDISTGESSVIKLNDSAINKLHKLAGVKLITPVISLVGRINMNRANIDTLVYSVPKEYLEVNKIKLIKGKYFASVQSFDVYGEVAGTSTAVKEGTLGARIQKVNFNILPLQIVAARKECSVDSDILGYVSRIEGGYGGFEYWGSRYSPFDIKGLNAFDKKRGIMLGLWIKGYVPLFQKTTEGIYVPMLDDDGRHKWENACLTEEKIQFQQALQVAEVLGESTESASLLVEASSSALLTETENTASSSATYDSAVVIASTSGGLEVVQLQASDSATTIASAKKKINTIEIKGPLKAKTVVSLGLLRLLSIPESKAIGTKLKLSYIIVKNLMPEVEGRVLTEQIDYTIVGVTDDEENQYIYVPYEDAKQIGIKNFSQVRIVFHDQSQMTKARKQIESMGYKTSSALDTKEQIESLFNNLRILLGLLGMVALGVAALGMFNTLTVSLLERTREIGGMKTMGVVSGEIQDLFLAEAMIMGLTGGIGGLILGDIIGKIISFSISTIAVAKGQGYLNVTFIPLFLTFFILLSSFIVGMVTGFYPAQRAKKISALNALRYE